MKNKFFRTCIVSVLIGSMFASTVMAAPDSNAIKNKRDNAKKEVTKLQDDMVDVLKHIDELETDLIEKGEEITKANEDLKEAEEKEKEQYEAMKHRIKYMYEQGDYTLIEKVMESGSISEFLSRAEYVQSVHSYDRKQLEEYVATKEEIADLKVKLEKEQNNLEKDQKEFASKKKSLDNLIASKKDEVEDLDKQFQAAVEQAAREREEAQKRPSNNGGSSRPSNGGSSRPSNGGSSKPSKPSNGGYHGTGDTSTAQAIVNAAYSQLGTPYVWGGTTPNKGLDCSGLTQYAHRQAGISIPRTSGPQGAGGKSVSNPQPGDLVCYSGHVGIYIGGGQMIHAPKPGDVVKVQKVYGHPWYKRYW